VASASSCLLIERQGPTLVAGRESRDSTWNGRLLNTGPAAQATRERASRAVAASCFRRLTAAIARPGRVAVVDDGRAGLFIHGWPPCTGRRCIVVSQGWEKLLLALAAERRGSIQIL
jgi:hypothetical protein